MNNERGARGTRGEGKEKLSASRHTIVLAFSSSTGPQKLGDKYQTHNKQHLFKNMLEIQITHVGCDNGGS